MQEMPAREVTITLFEGERLAVQSAANKYLEICHVRDHLVDVKYNYQAPELDGGGNEIGSATHGICLVTRQQSEYRRPIG